MLWGIYATYSVILTIKLTVHIPLRVSNIGCESLIVGYSAYSHESMSNCFIKENKSKRFFAIGSESESSLKANFSISIIYKTTYWMQFYFDVDFIYFIPLMIPKF